MAEPTIQSRATPKPNQFGDFGPITSGLLFAQVGGFDEVIPSWNPFFINTRDRFLHNFAQTETGVASAVYSFKTRMQTIDFKITGPDAPKKFSESVIEGNFTRGFSLDTYSELIGKTVNDLLVADNGAFWEVHAGGSPATAIGLRPILGVSHLDSRQCWRTFDLDFPIIYTNPETGIKRKIHKSRVIMAADNVQSLERGRGVGFCAVSRALQWARITKDSLQYREEKIAGKFTRGIITANGITREQLTDALKMVANADEAAGLEVYRNIPILTIPPGIGGASGVNLQMLNLASLPDGFVFKDDITLYMFILAFAFGTDAREFWPMTNSGATKGDATIQHLKAQGKGMAFVIKTLERMWKQALPKAVRFEYDFKDDEEDRAVAELQQTKTKTYDIAVKAGGMSGLEMRAMMMADGTLDKEVIETMEIPTDEIDTGRPQSDSVETDNDDDNNPPPGNDDGNDSDDDSKKKALAYKVNEDRYLAALRSAVRGFWTGDFSMFNFFDEMQLIITNHFTLAWNEGLKLSGIAPDEISDDERLQLQTEINQQLTFIPSLAQSIAQNNKANGGLLTPHLNRIVSWSLELERIKSVAQNMAAANQKAIWVVGATEHCETCLFYEGKVYRRKTWIKWLEPLGLLPRTKGGGLACGGWRCQCSLEDTDAPANKGRPPIWKG